MSAKAERDLFALEAVASAGDGSGAQCSSAGLDLLAFVA